jgi:plasmid replication initiation protein
MIKDIPELKKLLQAQNQLVVMDNQFVQKHCNTLSQMEATTLAWLISKIKPNDKPSHCYTVDCDELLAVKGWTNMRYKSVKDALAGLSKATWWLEGSSTKHQGYIIYEEVSYDSRLVRVWFLQSTHEFLFDLNKVHASKKHPMRVKAFATSYPFAYHSVMSCRYSIRIYELLKSYINKHGWIFEYNTGSNMDILHLLAQWRTEDGENFSLPSSWKNWSTFQRDVLIPVQADLKQYADITFSYRGLTHDMAKHTTRSVRCISFRVTAKTDEEKEAATRAINNKYREYINAWSAKHLSSKSGYYPMEVNVDIFSYRSSTPMPPIDNADQEAIDSTECNHNDSSVNLDCDYAILEDYDEEELPF